MGDRLPKLHGLELSTQAYAELADASWERIKHEHGFAMLVRDIEDVVLQGIATLRLVLRFVEEWHTWVSEEAARYRAQDHDLIRKAESDAVDATRRVLGLVSVVKRVGHNVEREGEFQRLASRLLGAAAMDDGLSSPEIRELREKAQADHRAGRTTEIGHWGE